jgi:hypothetical protein
MENPCSFAFFFIFGFLVSFSGENEPFEIALSAVVWSFALSLLRVAVITTTAKVYSPSLQATTRFVEKCRVLL